MKTSARPAFAALVTTVVAALGLLFAAAPASAASNQVSCRVTNQWYCVTAPLNLAGYTGFHVATLGIPGDSFAIVRDLNLAGQPEVLREYRYNGAEHDHWREQVYSRYRAELHCPNGCQGAVLYFNRY
ncbi:hypothetical protein [Saccharothrix stipae]